MGEHHRIWLVVLAIALLAVGCLAAGVAIARRRPGEIRRN
jgi:hypothetical protein